jgi:hypothetical protein
MPVEDMVAVAVATVGTVRDMPVPHMLGADTVTDMPLRTLRADTLVFVFAADVAAVLSAMRAETHASQGAHFTRLAAGDAAVAGEVAATGEVVDTGTVVIGIRTTDIPGLAITVWAMAIHTTGLAITVTAPVGTIIPTDTTTTLTATDTRCI